MGCKCEILKLSTMAIKKDLDHDYENLMTSV